MPFPVHQDFKRKLGSFTELCKLKKETFEGYDQEKGIMDLSFQASFLLFGEPLNGLTKHIYQNFLGAPTQKLNEVVRILDLMNTNDNYDRYAQMLDQILTRLENSSYEPKRVKNSSLYQQMSEVLTTAVEANADQGIEELNKTANKADAEKTRLDRKNSDARTEHH